MNIHTKLPRKAKKQLLGTKMTRKRLREILSRCIAIQRPYPFGTFWISPDRFHGCPYCGCSATSSTGNMAPYPEVWDMIYCLRCKTHIGGADNSPYDMDLYHHPLVRRYTWEEAAVNGILPEYFWGPASSPSITDEDMPF